MATTKPPVENYLGDGWQGSPLNDDERATIQSTLMDLLGRSAGVERIDLSDAHPALEAVQLEYGCFNQEKQWPELHVEVTLDGSETESDVVAGELPDTNTLGEDVDADVDRLRYLGDEWAALEADIVGEVVLATSLPSSRSGLLPFTTGETGLVCVESGDEPRLVQVFDLPASMRPFHSDDPDVVNKQLALARVSSGAW